MKIERMIELGKIQMMADEPGGSEGAPVETSAPAVDPVDAALQEQFALLDQDFDFDEGVDDGMGGGDVIPESTVSAPVEQSQGQPAAAPAQAAPNTPPVPAQPQAAQQPQGQQPPAVDETVAYQNMMGELSKKLENYYALTAEDAAALRTNPEVVLPKLAARLAIDTQQAISLQMARYLPQMVRRAMERLSTEDEGEKTFFQKWPMLNKPEFREHLIRLGTAYRQAYPTASADEFIQNVGAQAIVALRIPVDPSTGQPLRPSGQPVGFRPQGGGVAQPGGMNVNPFEQMAQEFLVDD